MLSLSDSIRKPAPAPWALTALLLVAISNPGPVAGGSWAAPDGVLASCAEAAPQCGARRGREIHLSPRHDLPPDCLGGSGSRACPFTDAAEALASLEPGDTLVLLAGEHRLDSPWRIEDLHGTPCDPVTIRAEEGAVFTTGIELEWSRATTGPDGMPVPAHATVFVADAPEASAVPNLRGVLAAGSAGDVALSRYPLWSDFTSAGERRRVREYEKLVCGDPNRWERTVARDADLYVGPGWYADLAGERIFLRLDPSETQSMQGLAVAPEDPSAARFHVVRKDAGISIRKSSHLVLRDLTFRAAPRLLIGAGAHHLEIDGLEAAGRAALVEVVADNYEYRRGACRSTPCHQAAPLLCPEEGACACVLSDDPDSSWHGTCFARRDPPHHIRFRNLRLDGGFPPWLFWTDLKSGVAVPTTSLDCEAAHPVVDGEVDADRLFEIRSMHSNPGNLDHHAALLSVRKVELSNVPDWPGRPYCIGIDGGAFEDGWFGAYVVDGDRVRIAGAEFRRIHDDAVLLHDDVARVEVAHNEVRDVLSAFSVAGGDAASGGEIFVHHNVVDSSNDGPPARERIACARPGDGVATPEWDAYDVDADGESDGFCTSLVFGGHGSWGERWQVYANTFLVDNLTAGGALATVRQHPESREPAHFVSNVLVQAEPGRPLYSQIRYDHFPAPDAPGGCPEPLPPGLQVLDGNLYWRTGDEEVTSLCEGAACCDDLDRLASASRDPVLTRIFGPSGQRTYSTLAHFQCDAGPDGLAARSACGYDLECVGCDGEPPGVNESRSRFADPGVARSRDYRPTANVAARVRVPEAWGWPEADWPWIGARAPWLDEDCVPFDPDRVRVEDAAGRFLLVDGSHSLFSFQRRSEADRALEVIRRYRTDRSCFIGRPQPSLSYLLVRGRSPLGVLEGESCARLNPGTIEVLAAGGGFRLTDGSPRPLPIGVFPSREEAERAREIVRTHRFTHLCGVGKPPRPAFTYFRR